MNIENEFKDYLGDLAKRRPELAQAGKRAIEELPDGTEYHPSNIERRARELFMQDQERGSAALAHEPIGTYLAWEDEKS